jgi:hypothetical protein
MNSAHIAWRGPICLIVLIAGSALSAAAQRTIVQVDEAVTEQQATIVQLRSRVEQLTQDNQALKRDLQTIKDRAAAPPEAWKAIGTVGLMFVLTWGAVTLVREWSRTKEIEAEAQQKIRTEIDQQVRLIESAATARITALTELLREARTSLSTPGAVKGETGIPALVREVIAVLRKSGR